MKIAYIAAGAAGMYCGNCLRDHALALALRGLGEEITLVPTYTPLLTDLPQGDEVRRSGLFFNGIRTYLTEKLPFFRQRRPWLDRILGSRYLVRQLSRMEVSTDPSRLGDITVSMLKGESGHQARELDELASWLETEKPDVIHLSNALLLGMARRLKEATGRPVVCSLQSEDIFVERLIAPYRAEAFQLIAERALDIDAFISVSEYYKDYASRNFSVDEEKIRVVLSGVPIDAHEPSPFRPATAGLTIGYLARMSPEKGLDTLCRAFVTLARRPGFERLRLKAAGYLPRSHLPWVAGLRRQLAAEGLRDRVDFLGTIDRQTKLDLLRDVDVLAVPTRHVEPKGLFVFEALASGVPLVLPDHGTFPELIEKSGGGELHAAQDVESLVAALSSLLTNDERRRSLAERARRSAEEYFNSRRMAEETLAVYHSLR